MSVYESSITNPKKQLEFYKDLSEQLQQENKQLKDENEELKFIVGLRQKRNLIRKFDEEYDAEDKKKNPNRTYAGITPDAEVVYQRYYKQKEVIEEVREIAYEYGQIDGAHHKLWVIDQMLRTLLGEKYQDFIKDYEENGEYTWDTGIAP